MFSIDKEQEALYEINKSKFFSFAYPVFDLDTIDALLTILQEKYEDATHICYAYTIDSPKAEKANDDGEPSGTAGKPILELLKKKKINNTLLVVVRYFGGIKLGAGGLVRAYTTAGNMALDKANIVEFVEVEKYLIKAPIEYGVKVRNSIISQGGEIISERYEDKYLIEFIGSIDGLQDKYKDIEINLVGRELRCR